ncbi:hypothetical protein SAMN05443507_10314 [Alicyclobacillus tolerans]|uniref:Uncharacterized protein n=1 Tax=Alicyclobacillus tolerans TaxID=90970 RepID=A0A1M6LLT5_9BACL|nr:hypothetical protein SAMN05443507_10314 [Alicyclobacillus montanus]
MEELKEARVYSYTRISYFVIYCIALIGSFVWALTVMFRLPSIQGAVSNWFRFDIPWVCLVILVWIPAIQRMSYRRSRVTLRLDNANSVCIIDKGAFAGHWRLHKKSAQSMSTAKALTIVGLVLIAFMVVINLMELHEATHLMSKVDAIQGLCEAVLLLGIFAPLLSFWRYPNVVVLRRGDRWLSVQYRD